VTSKVIEIRPLRISPSFAAVSSSASPGALLVLVDPHDPASGFGQQGGDAAVAAGDIEHALPRPQPAKSADPIRLEHAALRPQAIGVEVLIVLVEQPRWHELHALWRYVHPGITSGFRPLVKRMARRWASRVSGHE